MGTGGARPNPSGTSQCQPTPLLRGRRLSTSSETASGASRASKIVRKSFRQCFEEVLRVLRVCEPEQGAKPGNGKVGSQAQCLGSLSPPRRDGPCAQGPQPARRDLPTKWATGRQSRGVVAVPARSTRACSTPRAWGCSGLPRAWWRHASRAARSHAGRDPGGTQVTSAIQATPASARIFTPSKPMAPAARRSIQLLPRT